MKKIFSTLIIGALVCFLTVEGAYDCNDLLKQKKNSLDDYIICMSAIRYIEINDDNIKNVATLVKDCSEKIDAYDLKSDHSCLPNQAKQISQLDSIVVDFMKCATESRHEDDYLANYLFCHAEMMSKYNNDFNQKEEKDATTQELFGGYIGEENEDDFDYEYVVPVEDEDDGFSLGNIGSKAGRAFAIILYTFTAIIFLILLGIFIKKSFIKATDMKFTDVFKWSFQTAGLYFTSQKANNFKTYIPRKLKDLWGKIVDIMKGTGYLVIFCWFIGIIAIPIIGVINDESTEDIFLYIGIMFLVGLAAIIGAPLVIYLAIVIVYCLMLVFYSIPCFIFCFIIGLIGYISGKISKLFNSKKSKK